MSELRRQLQQARDAYCAIHYDGDLASEIDVNGRGYKGRLWIGVAVGAIAASLLLVVWMYQPAVKSVKQEVAVSSESLVPNIEESVEESLSFSDVAQNVSLDMPAQSFDLPGMPAFPSWETAERETPATTKESV